MSSTNGKIYEFGEFRLQPEENILEKNGERVMLKPKAFLTLVNLVESAGKLLVKSELLDKVWENSFVEEASVSKCIWEIRNALDDDSKSSKFIQTVPKRGYRFVADVKEISLEAVPKVTGVPADVTPIRPYESNIYPMTRSGGILLEPKPGAVPDPDVEPTTEPSAYESSEKPQLTVVAGPKKRSTTVKYIAAVCALAVIAAGLIYYFYPSGAVRTAASNDLATLAILPLKPVVAETRDESVEFAIAEALIIKAGEAKNLSVKRLFAVRKFTDLSTDPVEAGRELKVDYVLSSTYQIADDRIRVMSQLINISTGTTEQTFRSEASMGNIFEIQDTVSRDICKGLYSSFGDPDSTFVMKRGTDNEKAYELYQEGLYLVDKFTREDSEKAIRILDTATALDPNFAAAHAMKAQAYCQFAHLGGGPPENLFSIARPSLDKALAIDPDNAVALTVRGILSRDYYWNFPDAYSDLKKAIRIDPNSTIARRVLAGVYYKDSRFREAVEEQKRAVDLNPTDIWDKWFLADYQIAAGSSDDGIANLIRITEMDPSFQPAYYSLWRTYLVKGDTQKAFEYMIKSKQSWNDSSDEIARFEDIYQRSGWNGVLSAELALMRSQDRPGEYSTRKVYIAELAAQLGENDLAFNYLDEALEFRLLAFSYIKVDPLFDPIRSDPRYSKLLAQAKL